MSVNAAFPTTGTVLWGINVELERDVFRSGAASKPNVDYLRYSDLLLAKEGRIAETEMQSLVVTPGQGISLFLERKIPEGLVVFDPKSVTRQLKSKIKKIHWWGIDRQQPLPAGLQIIYDGVPPGHCTLTVTRQMPVGSFLALVAQITFSLTQIDTVVPIY